MNDLFPFMKDIIKAQWPLNDGLIVKYDDTIGWGFEASKTFLTKSAPRLIRAGSLNNLINGNSWK